MSVSVTTAATETELRDAVDDIQVPCARCGKPASKILRCRTVTSQHVLVCRTCLLLLEATTVTAGHIHCGHCDDIGSQLADVAEVLEINGGGVSDDESV